MTTNLDTLVTELRVLGDAIDAKGVNATAGDLEKLNAKMAEITRAKAQNDALGAANEARSFMSQLSGSGSAGAPLFKSRDAWADHVAKRVVQTVGQYGAKALSTGGIDIPSVIEPVVTKTVTPHRVLDLLINRKTLTGNEFAYLRQTVRTNNAAPVADNATKPTSVYTFEDEEDRARVFAHLSEAIPIRYLDDHEEIRTVLSSQMAEDLAITLEADVLTGDGTGEHFTGIANVATQTQAFSVNVQQTLRKARTKLLKSGETPNAWVMNYDDLEAIDMFLDADGNFLEGFEDKVFGNLPRVGTSGIPAGTAYLGDWNQARLYVRQAGRLDADASGVLFEKNQVKLRYEGRFGFAVLRPNAFVEIDLTA